MIVSECEVYVCVCLFVCLCVCLLVGWLVGVVVSECEERRLVVAVV